MRASLAAGRAAAAPALVVGRAAAPLLSSPPAAAAIGVVVARAGAREATTTSSSSAACSTSSSSSSSSRQRQQRRWRAAATTTAQQQQQPAGSGGGDDDDSIDYFAVDKRPVVLFDGVCNMCNTGVNALLALDPQGAFRLAALQSTPGRALLRRCGRAPDDISSIVLVEADGSHHVRSDAVLRIARGVGAPVAVVAALLAAPVPKPLRDALYDQVANNRYNLFGRRPGACRVSDDGFADRFLGA